MRAIPNMTVINPADHYEMLGAVEAALNIDGPVYIRLGRLAIESVNNNDDYKFELGKGVTLRDGKDVTIVATGLVVREAVLAAEELAKEGIDARVINIHTIKPIDEEIILKAAKETGRIITFEEHNVIGGLGDAVLSVVSEKNPVPVKKCGVYDRFGYSGPAKELLEIFGLTAPGVAREVKTFVGK